MIIHKIFRYRELLNAVFFCILTAFFTLVSTCYSNDRSTDGPNRYRIAYTLPLKNNHSCTVLKDGTTKCWGLNDFSQLGNNNNINSNSSTAVENSCLEAQVTQHYQLVNGIPNNWHFGIIHDGPSDLIVDSFFITNDPPPIWGTNQLPSSLSYGDIKTSISSIGSCSGNTLWSYRLEFSSRANGTIAPVENLNFDPDCGRRYVVRVSCEGFLNLL